MSSPERIQTSSQKSCVIVSRVSTPAANRSRRVTSPVSRSRAKIFSSTPGPPAPPVAEPDTGCQGMWSGAKNSSSGFGMTESPSMESDAAAPVQYRERPGWRQAAAVERPTARVDAPGVTRYAWRPPSLKQEEASHGDPHHARLHAYRRPRRDRAGRRSPRTERFASDRSLRDRGRAERDPWSRARLQRRAARRRRGAAVARRDATPAPEPAVRPRVGAGDPGRRGL